jgi:hypothetical protein
MKEETNKHNSKKFSNRIGIGFPRTKKTKEGNELETL